MLAYAVKNEDIDTMRMCYMIQAYSNVENTTKKLEPTEDAPKARIISSSGTELEDANGTFKRTGSDPARTDKFGHIVVKPIPLDPAGKGSGTMVYPTKSTTAAAPNTTAAPSTSAAPATTTQGGSATTVG